MPNKVFLILCVIVLLGVATIMVVRQNSLVSLSNNSVSSSQPPASTEPTRVENQTLQGEVICLPHKNSSGPQTLECAYGLKGADGKNYVLDSNALNLQIPPYQVGDRLQVRGTFTPIEMLSTDQWQKYDVVGIFSLTETPTKP